MALINCPECGARVSDKAPACIHCGYPLPKELAEVVPEQEKEEIPVIQESAENPYEADPPVSIKQRRITLKELLVLILGSLYITAVLISQYRGWIGQYPWTFILYVISRVLPAAAMIFISMKKKIPALILSALALTIWTIWTIMGAIVILYSYRFSDLVSLLFGLCYALGLILLFVYILNGTRHKNNPIWCILWCVHLLTLGLYEVVKMLSGISSLFPIENNILMLLYASFYFIGYSPDKWYLKKQRKENIE